MTAATLLRVAAALALLQGVAHGALIVFASPKHGPERVAVIEAMKSHRFDFLGAKRSYWDFYFGYALMAAIFCLVETAIFWLTAPLDSALIRPGARHHRPAVLLHYTDHRGCPGRGMSGARRGAGLLNHRWPPRYSTTE